MSENAYVPAPTDTASVALPDELKTLTELLAKNAHEVWAKTRMEQGWIYGAARDDARLRSAARIFIIARYEPA